MANNGLLEEFVNAHPGELQRRLADAFDALLTQTDDAAAEQLKAGLEAVLQERINALGQD